jgi:hypothetical protein
VKPGPKRSESNAPEVLIERDKDLIRGKRGTNYSLMIDNRDPRHAAGIKRRIGTDACSVELLHVIRIALESQNHSRIVERPLSELTIRNDEPGIRDRLSQRQS